MYSHAGSNSGNRGFQTREQYDEDNSISAWRISRIRGPDRGIGKEMRIKRGGELVQKGRRTCSKGAENLFKRSGELVQNFPRCASKKIPLPNRKNSLGQEKKFPWAREKILLGKRTTPFSLHFVKWYGKPVSFLAAFLRTPSHKRVNAVALTIRLCLIEARCWIMV